MDDLRNRVAENLKICRANARLTQEQVAERAGISVPFYANMESGKRLMRIETLVTLAAVLGVSTDRILLGEIDNIHIKNIDALLWDKPEPFIIKAEKTVRFIMDAFFENDENESE